MHTRLKFIRQYLVHFPMTLYWFQPFKSTGDDADPDHMPRQQRLFSDDM